MARSDPKTADCTRWQDRLPAKAMIGDETIAEYLARQREEQKRVRSIPYREETLDPFAERDAWLDLPEYMRRDPRGAF